MMELIAFFGTLWGRVAVGAGIVTVLAGLWFGWLWHHDNKVRASVFENSKIEGKKINEKNSSITARSQQPGAFDRLRKDSCRDC